MLPSRLRFRFLSPSGITRVLLVVATAPFLTWSLATAQQSNLTTEPAVPETAVPTVASVTGVPRFVRFTGTLTHPASTPTARMLFSIYEEREGQTPLWQEAQDVQVHAQGHFSVLLGSTRKDGLPKNLFVEGKAHWLGMQLQPGQGQEAAVQQPSAEDEQRVLLVGVPYALKAADADTLGGKPPSAYMLAPTPKKKGAGKATKATADATIGDANADASVTANAVGGTGTTNYVPLWLSSSTLGKSFLFQKGTNTGVGTTNPLAKLDVTSPTPTIALKGYNSATSGGTVGVLGQVSSTAGVAGYFNNSVGGQIISGRSKGVELFLVGGLGNVRSSSITARGHTNTDPNTNLNSVGVTAIGGNSGSSSASAAAGVRAIGGNGSNTNAVGGTGVDAQGGAASGAQSEGGAGGYFVGGDGVRGGWGISIVAGRGTTSYGGVGVETFGGNSDSGTSGDAVQAFAGLSDTGPGGNGVFAEGGSSNSGSPGVAVWARPGGNGAGQRGLAGLFEGNVQVQGNLSKAGGSFRIDHPLDPANKYLSHSFVESPDMKNIYDGVTTLDATGSAVVQLPNWFQALNRDFRYQLTCIGAFAPVYIAKKMENNSFTIGGGPPGMEISWQVTGIRQDAWANAHRIVVEELKANNERGLFLHPELHGQSQTKSVTWAKHTIVKLRAAPASPSASRP